ncbi:MAG: sugar phosphate isomerase/epimerase [Ruminococcaceae bacterium]|nr:sugar phosphate isomerase/epimerase [Oscillospiraceae bacterium]
MMKLGFCGSVDIAADVKAWGYDYIELALSPLAQMSEEEFAAVRQKLQASGLPCLACNIFLPRSVPVVGPAVDREACIRYAETAVARAAAIGAKVIVFGSSGSRNVPAGFPYSRALAQLRDFAGIAAGIAARHEITIVMEPLNATESNIMNRVSEALVMMLAVDHPNFKVLADTYHMDIEHESLNALQMAGPDLRHIHVSTFLGRKIPLASDKVQLAALMQMLKAIGYQGNVSIEAGFREDQAAEAKEALAVLRELL